MNTTETEEIIKLIRKICGKNLVLEKLQHYINQAEHPQWLILKFSYALHRSQICQEGKWKDFHQRFTNCYARQIQQIHRIERKHTLPPRIEVNNFDQLVNDLVGVWNQQVSEKYPLTNYVKNVNYCFRTPYSDRTLAMKLISHKNYKKNKSVNNS